MQAQYNNHAPSENVKKVVSAGANIIVAGSAIFGSNDIKQTVKLFRENSVV